MKTLDDNSHTQCSILHIEDTHCYGLSLKGLLGKVQLGRSRLLYQHQDILQILNTKAGTTPEKGQSLERCEHLFVLYKICCMHYGAEVCMFYG